MSAYHYSGGIVGIANAPSGTGYTMKFDSCATKNSYIDDMSFSVIIESVLLICSINDGIIIGLRIIYEHAKEITISSVDNSLGCESIK